MGSSSENGAILEGATAQPPSAEIKKKLKRSVLENIVFLWNTGNYLEIVLTVSHNLLRNDYK